VRVVDRTTLSRQKDRLVDEAGDATQLYDPLDVLLMREALKSVLKLAVLENARLEERRTIEVALEATAAKLCDFGK